MNRIQLASVACLALAGCDLDQSFLFPVPIDGVPGVVDLGTVVPVVPTDRQAVLDSVIFGELGPTGSAEFGGLTFNFDGVNGSVCIWVDPETMFWNQSISPSRPQAPWQQPDNVFDDGDLDLRAGSTAFYTGSPGVRIDDFRVRYRDALGNEITVSLNDCATPSATSDALEAHSGRGAPEFCTLKNTIEGVNYTVVLDVWSLPLDDDRLGYGLVVSEGDCSASSVAGGGNASLSGLFFGEQFSDSQAECLIRGESIEPGAEQGKRAAKAGLPSPTWIGDEVATWERAVSAEDAFCARGLDQFCKDERRAIENCSWEATPGEGGSRCYCGDPSNDPSGGF